MAKKLKYFLAVLLAALTFGGYNLLNNESVYAEDSNIGLIQIQVSPTKQKISLTPGANYTGTFKVMNVGKAGFNYTTSATPYSVTNDSYDADYATTTVYNQISEWITFDNKTKTGYLNPGEIQEVTYTVKVPEDVPAGGQYAVLMAQTDAGNAEDATINVVHRVGMILYAAVPGETRASGEIIKNTVNSFYFNPPITVSSLVKNTGNVEQTATYTTNIWPLFQKETVFSNADNPLTLDVIPETSRFNSISWDGAPSLGIFYVEQTIEFAGETSTVKKLVLICPLWLLFIIFALLFFIIFWLVSRSRDRKREMREARGEVKEKRRENDSKERKEK